MSHIDLEKRLSHWGLWTFTFESGEQGWPDESSIYKFATEGFTGNENRIRTSSLPYKHNKYAEPVDTVYNQLKNSNYRLAQAIYIYYAIPKRLISINQFSHQARIHPSTFYKRLRAAKEWISKRLPD